MNTQNIKHCWAHEACHAQTHNNMGSFTNSAPVNPIFSVSSHSWNSSPPLLLLLLFFLRLGHPACLPHFSLVSGLENKPDKSFYQPALRKGQCWGVCQKEGKKKRGWGGVWQSPSLSYTTLPGLLGEVVADHRLCLLEDNTEGRVLQWKPSHAWASTHFLPGMTHFRADTFQNPTSSMLGCTNLGAVWKGGCHWTGEAGNSMIWDFKMKMIQFMSLSEIFRPQQLTKPISFCRMIINNNPPA